MSLPSVNWRWRNHAPVLNASKSPVLAPENQNAGAPSGAVGTLVSTLVDFAVPAGQVDNVTDVDAGAKLGIAVTAADTTNGSLVVLDEQRDELVRLGGGGQNNARLLAADANTRLYFQPNANYYGTLASAITFRAWDQTSGTNGGLADTTSNGGTTAFSTATDTASLTVEDLPPVEYHVTFIEPLANSSTTEIFAIDTSGTAVGRSVVSGDGYHAIRWTAAEQGWRI